MDYFMKVVVVKILFICAPKMNKSLTGFERNEGERLMTNVNCRFCVN